MNVYMKNLVLTISGLHGTGKSTYARRIAEEFNLRHISAGELFRQIAAERKLSIAELSCEAEKNISVDVLLDERTRAEIRSGRVVVDGLLTGWMSRGFIALKIYLTTSYRIRIARIALRDGVSYAKAEKSTVLRESIEKRRFKSLYGIDIYDLSIYDLVLNTGLISIEHNVEIVKSFIEVYVRSSGEK